MPQTAKQTWCSQTGRMKNCQEYAEWEEGHSGESAMCNGGIFDGDTYDPCPSREPCRAATQNKYHLDVVGNRGYAPSNRTQIVGNTRPTASPSENGWRLASRAIEAGKRLYSAPTTMAAAGGPAQSAGMARPSQPQPGQAHYPGVPYPMYVPTPVQPPQQFPQAMQTPFAAPIPFHAGGVSPTFLPDQDEGILSRLGKNIGQGMIASAGWHIFDFARNVDMFGRRR